MRLYALFRLAFASAPGFSPLTSPQLLTRRLILQEARRQALSFDHCPPTACKLTVSGSFSLPLSGYFSPFPHGTCPLSVAKEYLALGGGPPGFPPGSTCPVVLRILPASFHPSPTRLSLSSVGLPRPFGWVPGCFRQSYNPRIAPGLGSSLFARRYFGNRVFFLLLRVLRCFSSPGSLLANYGFICG